MAKTPPAPKKTRRSKPAAKSAPVAIVAPKPGPTARELLLTRNDARSRLETLGTALVNATAQGLPVGEICADIAKFGEVADG